MVVFHHKDLDGFSSAAVVALFRNLHLANHPDARPKEANQNIIFHGLQYGDPVPVTLPAKTDMVYIVDFHLEPTDMQKLIDRVGADNIVWIDHHKTSLTVDYGVKLQGLRVDGKAGCRLTWEWFFGEKPLPRALELIEDYDIWRHQYPESRAFLLGMQTMPHEPHQDIWMDLLDESRKDLPGQSSVNEIVARGQVAQAFRAVIAEQLCQNYGFETVLDGQPIFVSSAGLQGSDTFGNRLLAYDIVAVQIFAGDRWVVSLYSAPECKQDLGALCTRMGNTEVKGGGHFHAAGFVWYGAMPPFRKGVPLRSEMPVELKATAM